MALFVFSNLREQKGGLTRAWLRRLTVFHEAGWDTHIATIHPQPEIDETLDAWRERGWLPDGDVRAPLPAPRQAVPALVEPPHG